MDLRQTIMRAFRGCGSLEVVILAALACSPIDASASPAPATIEGFWRTGSDGGVVRVERCGAAYCGRLVSAPTLAAKPDLRDDRNPDPSLRNRPLRGVLILTDFRGGPMVWSGDPIYNPATGQVGKTGTLTLLPNGSLEVKGCVAIFCRTVIWTRR